MQALCILALLWTCGLPTSTDQGYTTLLKTQTPVDRLILRDLRINQSARLSPIDKKFYNLDLGGSFNNKEL